MTRPFDLSYLTSVVHNADLSSYLATAIALGCLGGVVSGKVGVKDLGYLFCGLGMGATVAARASIKNSQDTKYILNDLDDLSAQARTNVIYKELQEPKVTLKDADWTTMALAGVPVSISGDRQKSLEVAEWLALAHGGKSDYVSDTPENIEVSQCVVPGQATVGSLMDILSYSVSPTYDGIIEALDHHLDLRRVDQDLRQPLVVVLDNPPRIPNTKHCASLNVYYIILGKLVDNWQTIEVGTEAYQKAQKQQSLPYWQTVLEQWNSGECPVLVNGFYARLPQK
jgi:hypothetical protein